MLEVRSKINAWKKVKDSKKVLYSWTELNVIQEIKTHFFGFQKYLKWESDLMLLTKICTNQQLTIFLFYYEIQNFPPNFFMYMASSAVAVRGMDGGT